MSLAALVRTLLRHEAALKGAVLVFQSELDSLTTSVLVHSSLPQWRPIEFDYSTLEKIDDQHTDDQSGKRSLPEIQASLMSGTMCVDPKWEIYNQHCEKERAHGLADVCYALRHIPENGIARADVFYTSPTNASLLYAAGAARPATTSEHEAFCAEEKAPRGRDRSTRCPSSLRPTLARLSFALRCSRGNGDRVGV